MEKQINLISLYFYEYMKDKTATKCALRLRAEAWKVHVDKDNKDAYVFAKVSDQCIKSSLVSTEKQQYVN